MFNDDRMDTGMTQIPPLNIQSQVKIVLAKPPSQATVDEMIEEDSISQATFAKMVDTDSMVKTDDMAIITAYNSRESNRVVVSDVLDDNSSI